MKQALASILVAGALVLGGATPYAMAKGATHAMKAQASALVDINSASKDQLDALKGVGPARADAIIKGRPYKGKDDLVKRNILPKSVYDGIKDEIVAKKK